jgi:CRISPR-associated endonuclease/helicase Cas3
MEKRMTRVENKTSRLIQLEALLLAHPAGLTQSELARRLSVNRSTINRYIPDLPSHIYIDIEDHQKWKIDRQGYNFNVRFNLNEAMAIHLAARLLATRMDRKNPYAATALRKLGIAMEKLAPKVSQHLQKSADAMDDQSQVQDPVYLQALEKLTLAWADQRKVHLWHRHENGQIGEYDFSTYFIEANAIGQSTYAIGFREPPAEVRTFKIERVERVEILPATYQIPGDFDAQELLADAWGIWYTESEPVQVVLKFSPKVARRILETRWHRSQIIKEEINGCLIWQAQIAEPKEMLPWIRGWGADCEVLEPAWLREELITEVKKLRELYVQ